MSIGKSEHENTGAMIEENWVGASKVGPSPVLVFESRPLTGAASCVNEAKIPGNSNV